MRTRRSLLLGLGILASLSMTIPVAAGNVEQAVVSSVEGQQDQTTPPSQSGEGNTDGNTEDNGEGNTGGEGVGTPEEEKHYPYLLTDGKYRVWDKEQDDYVVFEKTGVYAIQLSADAEIKILYLENGITMHGIITIKETEYYEGEGISSVDVSKIQPGKTYFFNDQGPTLDFPDREPLGVLQENLTDKDIWKQRRDGGWVCITPGSAVDTTRIGWQEINGSWKYLNESGIEETGKIGWQEINGSWKYLKEDGTVDSSQNGWMEMESDRWIYVSEGNGSFKTGWQQVNGKWYYLDKTGKRDTSKTGLQENVQGNTYLLSEDGTAKTGFQKVSGHTYYFDKDGKRQNYTGWKTIAGKLYYFNSEYQMINTGKNGWYYLNNQWYWMHNNGVIQQGWLKLGNTWYYLDANTGAMRTGWYQVNGTWYYSNENGEMQIGWLKLGETWYLLNSNGAMVEDWINLGGAWYYFTPGHGGMRIGWYQVNGTWYYSNRNGEMQTGWLSLGGIWYLLNSNGAMVEDWINLGGTWYYFTPGHGAMKTGWYQVNGRWYYSNVNGAMQTGWQKIKGVWYRFENDGTMVTGWKRIDGLKYYFDDSGKMLQDVESLIGKKSSYQITINRRKCQIMVYAKSETGKYDLPVKTFVCSVGLPATPTPTGTFHTLQKAGSVKTQGIVELMGPSWGKWGTMFTWTDKCHIWFHSVACGSTDPTYSLPAGAYNQLGMPASHGCVRLNVRDAKWIYMNCPLGTEVTVSDTARTPFDKPASIRIPAGQNWDPTDPAL